MRKLDSKIKAVMVVVVALGISVLCFIAAQNNKPAELAAVAQPEAAVEAQENVAVEVPESVVVEIPENVLVEAPQIAEAEAVEPAAEPQQAMELVVYRDKSSNNLFIPSGYMPKDHCIVMDDVWQENCQEGKTCVKTVYDRDCSSSEDGWAGIYWLYPANNWGEQKGREDLKGVKQLVFWARGEEGGEVIATFKAGGIGQGKAFPDTAVAETGPVALTPEWKQYTIDLTGMDMSNISGGFAWAASARDNPKPITFYVDDITYQ